MTETNETKKAKELIEISIPNTIFFPDWKGDRLYRSAKVGDNHKLTFGLPVPPIEELGKFYPGLDITAAVRQRSYASDTTLREAIEKLGLDYDKLDPEKEAGVKAAFAQFMTDLTTLKERETKAAAKKETKAKASAFDQMALDLGIDPAAPDAREQVRDAIAAIKAAQNSKPKTKNGKTKN